MPSENPKNYPVYYVTYYKNKKLPREVPISMDFTLKHCENFQLDYLLDEQDKTFISYDFI